MHHFPWLRVNHSLRGYSLASLGTYNTSQAILLLLWLLGFVKCGNGLAFSNFQFPGLRGGDNDDVVIPPYNNKQYSLEFAPVSQWTTRAMTWQYSQFTSAGFYQTLRHPVDNENANELVAEGELSLGKLIWKVLVGLVPQKSNEASIGPIRRRPRSVEHDQTIEKTAGLLCFRLTGLERRFVCFFLFLIPGGRATTKQTCRKLARLARSANPATITFSLLLQWAAPFPWISLFNFGDDWTCCKLHGHTWNWNNT